MAPKGVSKHICEEEPKGLFLHCYGHTHDLAVSDTLKGYEVPLDIAFEVSKLISVSPKHAAQLKLFFVFYGRIEICNRQLYCTSGAVGGI